MQLLKNKVFYYLLFFSALQDLLKIFICILYIVQFIIFDILCYLQLILYYKCYVYPFFYRMLNIILIEEFIFIFSKMQKLKYP